MFDLQSFATQARGTLPLAQDATLTWIGFNELDMPGIFDSRGVLSVLSSIHAVHWVPVLDTRENETYHWPLALTSRALVTLLLKGVVHNLIPLHHLL